MSDLVGNPEDRFSYNEAQIKGDFAYFPIKDVGAQLHFRIGRFKSAPSVFYGELIQMIQIYFNMSLVVAFCICEKQKRRSASR